MEYKQLGVKTEVDRNRKSKCVCVLCFSNLETNIYNYVRTHNNV